MDKVYYNPKDVSAMLGICYSKALALIKQSGCCTRINRTYIVRKDDFEEYLKNNKDIQI